MEYLKSGRFLALLFLIVTLAVGCVAMITTSHMYEKWNDVKEQSLQAGYWGEASEHGEDNVWIVKAHDGQIGVFGLNGELEFVLDVYLITLPEADQALLHDGIYVAGRDRLTALVEDYTG